MSLAALPDAAFLPGPLWLLTTLHVVTLTLHFLAMNALLGSVVFVLFAPVAGRSGRPAVRRLVTLLPSLMAATVTLGVAPLLFVQVVYGRWAYAAAIAGGTGWVLIPFAALAAYALFYAVSLRGLERRGSRVLLGLALAALLFVSVVYSGVFSLTERPGEIASAWAGAPSGVLVAPDAGAWLPRWLHAVLGALTVGFVFVRLLDGGDADVRRASLRLFLGAYVLASLAGVAYLLALTDHLKPLMRSSGIWWLTAGVVASLGAAHLLFKGKVALAAALTGVVVLAMVATRHALRLLVLGGAFDAALPPVRTPWSILVVFLLTFVAALATCAWMLRRFFREGAAPTPPAG